MRSLLTGSATTWSSPPMASEALESWLSATSAGTPYDLVLMDIQMPRLERHRDHQADPRKPRVRATRSAGRRSSR